LLLLLIIIINRADDENYETHKVEITSRFELTTTWTILCSLLSYVHLSV